LPLNAQKQNPATEDSFIENSVAGLLFWMPYFFEILKNY
jgi:hypothetical protein